MSELRCATCCTLTEDQAQWRYPVTAVSGTLLCKTHLMRTVYAGQVRLDETQRLSEDDKRPKGLLKRFRERS